MRFVGDVSRVFLATVLRGLGTKPAGVLLFRIKELFVGFCLVACRLPVFLFLFGGFQRQRFGNFSGCSFAMA